MGQNEKVGGIEFEAVVDTTQLEASGKKLATGLSNVEASAKRVEKSLGGVEEGGKRAAAGFNMAGVASKALSFALGYLGATSIGAVVIKMINLAKQSFSLAISLKAVESQARAVFGNAFPQMQKEADRLALAFGRSSSDMLKFMAGFGDFLDQLGVGPAQTQKMSVALTELTAGFSKLKPNIPDDQIFEALQAGLAGSYKPLRQLDILVKADTLQQFANGLAIRNKVKDMDAEQTATLVTLYLTDQMKKKQGEIAKATGDAGDAAKTAGAAWQDLEEEFGKDLSPIVADALRQITEMLTAARKRIEELGAAWAWLKGLFGGKAVGPANAASGNGTSILGGSLTPKQGQQWTASAGRLGTATENNKDLIDILNKSPQKSGGGGGNQPLEDAKQLSQDIDKIEKNIADELGKQIDANKERIDRERESLKLKKEMGTITKDEQTRLDRLNDRIAFGKDKINDATDAWKKQQGVVDDLKKSIAGINDEIQAQATDLKKTLGDIDKSTKDKKNSLAADLIKERNELERFMTGNGGNGMTSEQSFRWGQLNAQLAGQSDQTMQAGTTTAGLTDFQKLDAEGEKAKKDAADEANQKLQENLDNLVTKQGELAQAQIQEKDAIGAVETALTDLQSTTETNYKAIEVATKTHVANEITELDKLQAKLQALSAAYSDVGSWLTDQSAQNGDAPQNKAAGGPVFGPGTGTSDSIPANLSNGEHVLTARDVIAMGGHSAVLRMRSMLHRTFPVRGYAEGGPVTQNNQKSASIVINNHGDAARVYADPRRARWHARTFLG